MIGCYDDCSGPLPFFTCFLSLTRNSICTSLCGDGVRTPNEGCDDGNALETDGCYNNCTEMAGWSCRENIYMQSVCTTACGNGVRDSKEKEGCDDGNNFNGDGCSSTCVQEEGFVC